MNLKISELHKIYENSQVPAVCKFSLDINDGELVTLLGPSGCGKTTVLRMVAGLENPSSGQILSGGTLYTDTEKNFFLPPHKRNIGMVFQNYALWPHMTVKQNVAFPLKMKKFCRKDQEIAVADILDLVELSKYAERYPSQLSGGQQQRVALARALVSKPNLLLFDEPLSNLDAKLRNQMRRELKDLQKALRITSLYVTHDKQEALELSDRIVVMDQGKLVQVGVAESLLKNPANEFVRYFIN